MDMTPVLPTGATDNWASAAKDLGKESIISTDPPSIDQGKIIEALASQCDNPPSSVTTFPGTVKSADFGTVFAHVKEDGKPKSEPEAWKTAWRNVDTMKTSTQPSTLNPAEQLGGKGVQLGTGATSWTVIVTCKDASGVPKTVTFMPDHNDVAWKTAAPVTPSTAPAALAAFAAPVTT